MPSNRNGRPNPDNQYRGGKPKKTGMNMIKVFSISLLVVLAVVVISGGLIYKLGHNLYSSGNYVADEENKVVETLPAEVEEETVADDERQGVAVSNEELDDIHDKMAALAKHETVSDEDIYNLLLIGVDRRDKSWNGNSDCMILCSINKKDNRVTMVSLMRDTYVDIPGIGYRKLNAAYAYGAGTLLCETVTDTFKIKVDRYAAVDFFDLIDIIDAIGGVSLQVTAKEAEVANGYALDMCNLMNISPEGHQIPAEGGFVRCDGVTAVAYARNRYVGNSDFQRTERQRYVIQQLMAEVKQMSVPQMTEVMKEVLKYVTTNIPETEVWSMLLEVPDILKYKFDMDRIPYDDAYSVIYVNSQDMLVPDWDVTLNRLQEFIYGKDGKAAN